MTPKQEILSALKKALSNLKIQAEPTIENAASLSFGDYTSNIILRSKISPRETQELVKKLNETKPKSIGKIEVKGGFINFWLAKDYLQKQVLEIIKLGSKYGSSDKFKGKKARVEFISANPTGPLHIGNARGGPIGDVLSNVLGKVGFQITREYLHNDVGGQVRKLGESLYYSLHPNEPHEELSYQGEYIKELAQSVGKKVKNGSTDGLGQAAVEIILDQIIDDAKAMGIKFDLIRKESDLRREVPKVLDNLKRVLKEKEGALWFAPSDEFLKDRETVVRKSDGEFTYFASDIAYHNEKFEDADLVIDVLGSNHSGHVPRLRAAINALGFDISKFRVILYQFVRIKKGELAVKMSKRQGEFITAREVLDLVGKDAFRFFLLTNSPETHMDFDLELAKKRAKENPVYYVQYANSRISSIFSHEAGSRSAGKKAKVDFSSSNTSLLKEEEEILLIRHLIKFPDLVEDVSKNFFVHWLTSYAYDLANLFHKFYETHTVLSEDKDKAKARLALLCSTQIVLKETLTLLGIESPERM